MPIDSSGAEQLAEQKIGLFEREVGQPLTTVPLGEVEEGWLFGYQTKAYLEDDDFEQALGGNAPFLVKRSDGEIVMFGTAQSLEHYLDLYRAGAWDPARASELG